MEDREILGKETEFPNKQKSEIPENIENENKTRDDYYQGEEKQETPSKWLRDIILYITQLKIAKFCSKRG